MSDLTKCILVGHGYWGSILEKYLEGAGFETEYVYTGRSGKSFDEVLAASHAEAVFICSPVGTHYEYASRSLALGKHVFCEKMLTGDSGKAAELFAQADRTGKVLFTDYIYLYSPSVRRLKELIRQIGPVQSISAEITQFGKFYKDADVTGNIGVHMISSAGFLTEFGTPADITRDIAARADLRRKEEEPAIYEAYDLDPEAVLEEKISYNIGAVKASVHASVVSDEKVRRITVKGFKGEAVFDMMKEPTLEAEFIYIGKKLSYHYDEMNNLAAALKTFHDVIDGNSAGEDLLNRRCSEYVEKFISRLSQIQ